MDAPRTAKSLEYLRWLAVTRVLEGHSVDVVAQILGVSERSVWRWLAAFQREGEAGLAARPGRGRPPKLGPLEAEQIFRWVEQDASKFGFRNEWWTAPRVVQLIQQRFGIDMNPRYLNDWLRRHGVTPQMPQPKAKERGDDTVIQGWLRHQWPRIKKRPVI